MEEEHAICRVCRSGNSASHPLYHPCKCSGSIRFVHQDCLVEWLSHSKKKYCELCEYSFVFTPIYRQEMPNNIPLKVVVRQSVSALGKLVLLLVRSILAVCVWLIVLPVVTLWTWRFYFWSGENIAFKQVLASDNNTENSLFLLHYNWREFLTDCFEGQIIIAVVVLVFIAAYLFREWVIQNCATNQQVITDQENNLEHQQSDVDNIAHTTRYEGETNQNTSSEREQIDSRLEELRRELEKRRKVIETQSENTSANENEVLPRPISYHSIEDSSISENNGESTSSGYYLNLNRSRTTPLFSTAVEDDSDDDMIYTSGAQSPFVSWRDYQQGLGNSNNNITPSANRIWRASEFSGTSERLDYFNQFVLNSLDSDPDTANPHTEAPEDNNNEELNMNNRDRPFDIVEDIDSILEAIGICGNPLMLLKNSILMFLMINLCLCITIWIPYVIGRSLILLQPTYIIYMFRALIDPVTNTLYNTFHKFWFFQSVKSNSDWITSTDSILHYFCKRSAIMLNLTISVANRYWNNNRQILLVILKRCRECALQKGGFDRIVCTIFGYALLITLGSWYLSISKRSRPGTTNEVLRQQGVFLKVLLCVFLELVLFPTVCGILIDISTLPLFAGCSIHSRLDFLIENPYSGVFLHWFVGTGFVFQYSTFIILVREVVRPGVLWFINNPNDPQFHPVQEMAERPILLSLKKMCISAMIYFILLMIGMGLVTLLISKYSGIYPVLWSFNTPFSTLPVDLLAIQFILPPIISYMVPREFSKKALSSWWHITSRHLRLTSYMFGGRYPNEEGVFIYKARISWLLKNKNSVSNESGTIPEFRKDGVLVLAPKRDNISLSSNRRMLIPVDPVTFQPINELERQLGHPAVSQPGTEDLYTTLVYLPPFFKTRIAVFLFLIWLSGSLLVCSFSVIPLLLGRNIFNTFLTTNEPLHDIYSFGLGSFVMITMSYSMNWVGQKYSFFEENGRRVNIRSVVIYVYNRVVKFVHLLFITISFGFILPIMIGIALDLYILMPLRLPEKDVVSLDVNLLEDWAFGLTTLCLFYGVTSIISNNTTRSLTNQLTWEHLVNTDMKITLTRSLMPAITIVLIAISLPTVLAFIVIHLFAIGDPQIKVLVFRCIYPIVFFCACLMLAFLVTVRLVKIWLRSIRDKTYLTGKKLHDLENID